LFAVFPLVGDATGRETLRRYYEEYAGIAQANRVGIVLESPTWRANPDWAPQLGYTLEDLDGLNRAAIELMEEIRQRYDSAISPIVVSGCLGPRGDGYVVDATMSAEEAEEYHGRQVGVFAASDADMFTALTMTYAEEAVGVARAAAAAGIPSAISFTVETDGCLASGQPLGEAIAQVDDATRGAPAYFMINCAHPTHFAGALEPGATWVNRIRGLRANASARSHAELDEAEELDEGNPKELGAQYRALRDVLPAVSVLGGCCGTDHRHVTEICSAWLAPAAA
jgi:S-methylmethionine-dependent homocysteine/selenocysteine methylase